MKSLRQISMMFVITIRKFYLCYEKKCGQHIHLKLFERKLDIHQQSLSRALKRLLDLNLIEKTSSGLRVS